MDQSGVFPKFSLRSVQHKAASEQAGRPIFKDVEWLDIIIAGDKNTQVSRKVNDLDKKRFAQHYQAFKQGLVAPTTGTPLKEWPILTPAQVDELKYLNFLTVESVAEMSDAAMQSIGMGGRELKNKAKAWLASALKGATSQKLVAENERLSGEVDMLKDQLKAMNTAIEELKKEEPKPKRKRRTKAEMAKEEPTVSSLAGGV